MNISCVISQFFWTVYSLAAIMRISEIKEAEYCFLAILIYVVPALVMAFSRNRAAPYLLEAFILLIAPESLQPTTLFFNAFGGL